MEETTVTVRPGGIRLGQLLKLTGAAGSGAEAGAMITDGDVSVDGSVETRRGRQLADGSMVEVRGPASTERFRVEVQSG